MCVPPRRVNRLHRLATLETLCCTALTWVCTCRGSSGLWCGCCNTFPCALFSRSCQLTSILSKAKLVARAANALRLRTGAHSRRGSEVGQRGGAARWGSEVGLGDRTGFGAAGALDAAAAGPLPALG